MRDEVICFAEEVVVGVWYEAGGEVVGIVGGATGAGIVCGVETIGSVGGGGEEAEGERRVSLGGSIKGAAVVPVVAEGDGVVGRGKVDLAFGGQGG